MKTALSYFCAFQFLWWITLTSAAEGRSIIGITAIAIAMVIHLSFWPGRPNECLRLLAAGALGFCVEIILRKAGALSATIKSDDALIWLTALWFAFAATIPATLSALSQRYVLCAILAFFIAPISYFLGEQMGAVQFPESVLKSLFSIAIAWAFSFPILVFSCDKARSWRAQELTPIKQAVGKESRC